MNSPSTPYITSRNMDIYDTSRNIGIYEPMHQMSMWADIKSNGFLNTSTSMLVEVDTKIDNQVHSQLSYVKLHVYYGFVLAILLKEICLFILFSQKILHTKHLDILTSMTRKRINRLIR